MKKPLKLKIILILWGFIGAIWTIVLGGLLLYGTYQVLLGISPNPFPYNIIILLVVLAFVIPGVILVKTCNTLWHGNNKGDLALNVFAGFGLLSFPIGTLLSIATFMIMRDSEVKTYLNKGTPPMTKEELLRQVNALKEKTSE